MAPRNLTTVAQMSTIVQLNWTAPSAANYTIINYIVHVQFPDLPYNYDEYISSGSNATTFEVTGLVPCTLYTFSVGASTMCSGSYSGPYSDALENVGTAYYSMHHI